MIGGKVKLDLKNIGYVRGSIQNKATRIAINRAAVPVRDAVVASAPKDFGYLKQSIRIRSKYYAKSKTWAVIVGPSMSFSRKRKKPKKQKTKKPNKTLQRIKKRLTSVAKKAKRTAAKEAGRLVSKLGGKRGRKLVRAVKGFTKKPPKPRTPKKKVIRRKRKWNGKPVRPARYAHLMEWGSQKLSAKRFLTRALGRSRSRFASLMQSGMKSEIASLLSK
jgi:hypothetical protein